MSSSRRVPHRPIHVQPGVGRAESPGHDRAVSLLPADGAVPPRAPAEQHVSSGIAFSLQTTGERDVAPW